MASKRLRPTLPVETDVATRELRSRGGRRRPPLHAPVESAHVVCPNSGMAGLRRLVDYSVILADGASAGASLAGAGAFAAAGAGSRLDSDVGGNGRADRAMAQRSSLFDLVELASSRFAVWGRHVSLSARGSALQPGATRRPARDSAGAFG